MITNALATRMLAYIDRMDAKYAPSGYRYTSIDMRHVLAYAHANLNHWIAVGLFPKPDKRVTKASTRFPEAFITESWSSEALREWLAVKLRPETAPSPGFGTAPVLLGEIELNPTEMCFVQYMPIAMKGCSELRVPEGLKWVLPLLDKITFDLGDEYVYLTAKHMFVTPENMGNRGGWHTDGFGTADLNYAWVDKAPTEYCVQPFSITPDDTLSLYEMEVQVDPTNITTYGDNMLVLIDQHVVHRVPVGTFAGLRTFVRFSTSQDQYNMYGNAHNPLFDYKWDMKPRAVDRNTTAAK